MSALRKYSVQREFDLAWAAFDSANEHFQMASKTSKVEVERSSKASAAKYMSDGFRHLSLAEQLTAQEVST